VSKQDDVIYEFTPVSSHSSPSGGFPPKLGVGIMSFSEISSPISSGRHSGTPSPTLSSMPLASRPLAILTSATSLSQPISPVIKPVASTFVMIPPPITLQEQREQQEQQKQQASNHVRSNSVPSLQWQSSRPIKYQVTLLQENTHSSSAVNLLALRAESIFASQTYTAHFPKSPRLMPCISPGPVTPMQLEEDFEYQIPCSVSTPIRHSPLVMPEALEEEGIDAETCLETPIRDC
jgi:hypothetical protein